MARRQQPDNAFSSITAFAGDSDMSRRARAAASAAASAFSVAAGRARNADTLSLKTGFKSLWAGLTESSVVEKREVGTVLLQPGWAVKRVRDAHDSTALPSSIVVFVQGACIIERDPTTASRTQRAFVSLARRFAALPSLDAVPSPATASTSSHSVNSSADRRLTIKSTDDRSDQHSRAHQNLDARLRPFWSSLVPNQSIRIRINVRTSKEPTARPAHSQEVILVTDSQGYFQKHIDLQSEELSEELGYAPESTGGQRRSGSGPKPIYLDLTADVVEDDPHLTLSSTPAISSSTIASAAQTSNTRDTNQAPHSGDALIVARNTAVLPVSEPGGVRVLSDIDDTIKHSDILGGIREVFRNVFCGNTEDMAVAGMSNLFGLLAQSGARGFHYVSNSPIELAAPIIEFLHFHSFPAQFSLTLKAYGGRSLLTSLFEQPMERKGQSALRLLNAFPQAKFLFFGDSGEQDLELYLSLARAKPQQVLAVYIRDITSRRAQDIRKLSMSRRSSVASGHSFDALPAQDSPTTNPSREVYDEPLSYEDGPAIIQNYGTDAMIEAELTGAQQKILRQATMWDERVATARSAIPSHIPLVLFADPEEIVDVAVELVRRNSASDA